MVAGAGSGKTRVITYRLARLVAAGSDPRRILAVTFTNKAAGELRERVATCCGSAWGSAPTGCGWGRSTPCRRACCASGASPSACSKDFVIYDDDDQKRLLARVLTDLEVPERMFPVRQVLSAIDRAKNQGIRAARLSAGRLLRRRGGQGVHAVRGAPAAANATDFGGLLIDALRVCEEPTPARDQIRERFDHVLVDEFQDTNSVQYRLVRNLLAAHRQHHRRRRRGPVDLQVARRRHPQHPRLRARPRGRVAW